MINWEEEMNDVEFIMVTEVPEMRDVIHNRKRKRKWRRNEKGRTLDWIHG